MSKSPPRFCVIVPVKPPARAKSRLAALGDQARQALVTAFALDTVAAAAASPMVGAVLVVTDDHVLAAEALAVGACVVPDGVAGDLNATLVQAAAEARRRRPDLLPVAVCADLPALRPTELTLALGVASEHRVAFVPDRTGGGTTMLATGAVAAFAPRFGPESREAHLADGGHEIVEVDVPTLRRDVDTPEDLREALRLGVGAHTALVATGLRL
jgi:2-phospho-L-lactate guanylyltransferase